VGGDAAIGGRGVKEEELGEMDNVNTLEDSECDPSG
jgi:hypothetical protein